MSADFSPISDLITKFQSIYAQFETIQTSEKDCITLLRNAKVIHSLLVQVQKLSSNGLDPVQEISLPLSECLNACLTLFTEILESGSIEEFVKAGSNKDRIQRLTNHLDSMQIILSGALAVRTLERSNELKNYLVSQIGDDGTVTTNLDIIRQVLQKTASLVYQGNEELRRQMPVLTEEIRDLMWAANQGSHALEQQVTQISTVIQGIQALLRNAQRQNQAQQQPRNLNISSIYPLHFNMRTKENAARGSYQ